MDSSFRNDITLALSMLWFFITVCLLVTLFTGQPQYEAAFAAWVSASFTTGMIFSGLSQDEKPKSPSDGIYEYRHEVYPDSYHIEDPLAVYVIQMRVDKGEIKDIDVSLLVPNADKDQQIRDHLRPINIDKYVYPYEIGDKLLTLKSGWKRL